MGRLSSTSSGGRLGSSTSGGRIKAKTQDLSTVEGIASLAESKGYGDDVAKILGKKDKMSVLQRLSAGLGAFNPANALLTGKEKGIGRGLLQYPLDIAKGVGSAITGTNYQKERKYFADVAEEFGVENKIAKFGIGFAGDVLLDPTTYFGGAIAKGVLKGGKMLTSGSLKALGKVAPTTEQAIRLSGTAAKDAFARAFVVGYKSSKGSMDDVTRFLSKREAAKFGIASSNLNRLGTGILTKSQQEELALKLISGKRAEFVARETGKSAGGLAQSADPLVNKVIQEQSKRSLKFGEQLGLENPYESYFPFIKKENLTKFLKETQTSGIKVGSEAYRKQFRNLLSNENLELDPVKAFFTVEARQATDKMTRDFLGGFVKKYGRGLDEFKNSDDALANGYKVLREKGIFGKEVGYITADDARLLNNLIDPEFQTVNMLAKATGFDAVTNLFKRSVTGLFAPFHVRNYVSGMIQNFETLGVGAFNPKAIAAGQKMAYILAKDGKVPTGIMTVAGKPMKMSQVYKAFKEMFGTDTFYQNDFLEFVDKGSDILKSATPMLSKASLKETVKTLGLGGNAIPFRTGRAVGQFIEHQQKATAYIVALNQGKTIQEALSLATRAGFDYRALTKFESQILRRIVPFYSFTRKNIELQLRTLGEHPERINQVLAAFNNMGERIPFDEQQSLPEYIQNSLGVKVKDLPSGLKLYLSSFGTPIEQATGLFNANPILTALSMTNPLLKTPIELGIGKDSFRQQDLKDVYNAKEYALAPQLIKDLLLIKEVTKPILKKLPNGKFVQTGTQQQYVADPARLLIARSLFTSRGITYLDTIFNGDVTGFTKFLKLTTGLKPQEINLEMFRSLKERDQLRAIEDLLQKTGDVSIYRKAYEPK